MKKFYYLVSSLAFALGYFIALNSKDGSSLPLESKRGLSTQEDQLLPELDIEKVSKVFKLNRELVLVNNKRMRPEAREWLEEELLREVAAAENPKEFFKEKAMWDIQKLQPLSHSYFAKVLEEDFVSDNDKRFLLTTEIGRLVKDGRDFQPIAELIFAHVEDKDRSFLFGDYFSSLAETDPQAALDAYSTYKNKKYFSDPFSNGLSMLIGQVARKDLEATIDLINANASVIKGHEERVGMNLSFRIEEKYPNDVLEYVEKIKSVKIQQKILRSIYLGADAKTSQIKRDQFLKQVSANPELYQSLMQYVADPSSASYEGARSPASLDK